MQDWVGTVMQRSSGHVQEQGGVYSLVARCRFSLSRARAHDHYLPLSDVCVCVCLCVCVCIRYTFARAVANSNSGAQCYSAGRHVSKRKTRQTVAHGSSVA